MRTTATFSPLFFKPKNPQPTSSKTRSESQQVRLYYSDDKYKSIENFLDHSDFPKFKENFTDLIDSVVRFSIDHANDLSPPISQERLAAINRNFHTLKNNLFNMNENHFSAHKKWVYGAGKEYFDKFVQLLHDEKIPVDRRFNAVSKLSGEVTACSGGLLTGLQDAIGALKALRSGIKASAKRLKTQIAETVTLQYVQDNHQYKVGDEVHFVNAYFNHSAPSLGIKPRKDPFADIGLRLATKKNRDKCSAMIHQELTPASLVTIMADDYLGRITEAVSTVVSDPHSAISNEKIGEITDVIHTHQEASLTAQYGEINVFDILEQSSPVANTYQVVRQPTLIARRMLETLKGLEIVQYDDAIILRQGAIDESNIMQLDSLLWLERDGEYELLSLERLCEVSPKEILATMRKTGSPTDEECATTLERVVEHVLKNYELEKLRAIPENWFGDFVISMNDLPADHKKALSTPLLMLAVQFDRPKAMPGLLAAGADTEAKTSDGDTLLIRAAKMGQVGALKALLDHGVDINKPINGCTALMHAADSGKTSALKLLLDAGADIEARLPDGATALAVAAKSGNMEMMELLLEKGADIEAKTLTGDTALTLAATYGHTQTSNYLLENGADIEATLPTGETSLLLAAILGHTGLLKVLLDKGAKVEAKNRHGRTALMLAAFKGDLDATKLLLAAGAIKKTVSRNGQDSAWTLAQHSNNARPIRAMLNNTLNTLGYKGLLIRTAKRFRNKFVG